MFEKVSNVEGQSLPAPILEADPKKALRRGIVMLLRWLRRSPGITPSRLMGRFSYAALVVAGAVPMTSSSQEIEDRILRDYSVFCRATSALWHLRFAHNDYRELTGTLLGTEKEAVFAHDEFALFIAAQLGASGVTVRPTPATGAPRPDLHMPNALVQGGTLYWECKERDPNASRDPSCLLRYFRKRLCEGSQQIKGRETNSCGIVSIDMGIIERGQRPPQDGIVAEMNEAMAMNTKLIGVSISATCLDIETGTGQDYLQPVFISQLRLPQRALQDQYCLRPDVCDGIRHAMPYPL